MVGKASLETCAAAHIAPFPASYPTCKYKEALVSIFQHPHSMVMFRMEWFLGGCARHARMGGILFLTLHAEFGDRMPPRMAPLCPPYMMTSPPIPPRRWEHGKEVFTEVRSPEEFDAVVLGADRPVMVDW